MISKKRKKLIRIALAVLILAAAGVSFGLYEYFKPNARTSDLKADYTTSAEDFYNFYSEFEDSANHKFMSKVIEVTGKVSSVKSDTSGMLITLDGGNGMFGVSCSVQRTGEEVAKPEKESTITVRGICVGMLMDIQLTRCVIVKPENN